MHASMMERSRRDNVAEVAVVPPCRFGENRPCHYHRKSVPAGIRDTDVVLISVVRYSCCVPKRSERALFCSVPCVSVPCVEFDNDERRGRVVF